MQVPEHTPRGLTLELLSVPSGGSATRGAADRTRPLLLSGCQGAVNVRPSSTNRRRSSSKRTCRKLGPAVAPVLRSLDRGIYTCMTAPHGVRVLFLFPDSSELRDVRKPPRRGHHVRSPEGAVWKVAEILKSGHETYTVTCVAPSRMGKMPNLAADHMRNAVRRRTRDPDNQDLAADLLERARKSISPHEIRSRRRRRNYMP